MVVSKSVVVSGGLHVPVETVCAFQVVYTSRLKRSVRSAWILLKEMNLMYRPIRKESVIHQHPKTHTKEPSIKHTCANEYHTNHKRTKHKTNHPPYCLHNTVCISPFLLQHTWHNWVPTARADVSGRIRTARKPNMLTSKDANQQQ